MQTGMKNWALKRWTRPNLLMGNAKFLGFSQTPIKDLSQSNPILEITPTPVHKVTPPNPMLQTSATQTHQNNQVKWFPQNFPALTQPDSHQRRAVLMPTFHPRFYSESVNDWIRLFWFLGIEESKITLMNKSLKPIWHSVEQEILKCPIFWVIRN